MKPFNSFSQKYTLTVLFMGMVFFFFRFAANGQGGTEIFRFEQGSTTPTVSDPNITVSNLTIGSGVTNYDCSGTYNAIAGIEQGSPLDALNNGDYWEFTVTPNAGYLLDWDYIRLSDIASNHVFVPNTTLGTMYRKIGSGGWSQAPNIYRSLEITGSSFCNNSTWDSHQQNWAFVTDQTVTFRIVRYIYDGNPNGDVRDVRIGMFWAEGASILPVELTSFEAQKKNESVALTWETASETENDFFQLEHSMDGRNFYSLEKIKGNGTSSVPHEYKFTHISPRDGDNYYRLRQVDFDGTFEFSKTVSVEMSSGTVSIFPNPASEFLTIKRSEEGEGQVNVYDSLGRLVKAWPIMDAEQLLEVTDLEPGVYYFEIFSGNRVEQKQVVKK